MRSGIFVQYFAVFLIFACFAPSVIAENSFSNSSITLERGMCYGTCPVYALTLSGNGTVIYDGQKFVKETGVREGTINETSYGTLMDLVQKIRFSTMKNAYTSYDITDMPTAVITLTLGDTVKQVEHYHGDMSAPKSLLKLEDAIDLAGNVTRWSQPWEMSEKDMQALE